VLGACDQARRKYAPRLAYWVSEKDRGQTHAINKGLQRATGDIIAYLNSDDFYLPNSLKLVAEFFLANPGVDLVHGRCRIVDAGGNKTGQRFGSITTYPEVLDLWDVWWKERNFVQPEVFWTKRVTDKIGPFREDLYFVMDYEYWARILRAGGKVGRMNAELACFRLQPGQKSTQPQRTADELLSIVRPWIWDKAVRLPAAKRFELKGKWAFDAMFRKEADRSLQEGESRWRRWLRLAWLVSRRPYILSTAMFRDRLFHSPLGG